MCAQVLRVKTLRLKGLLSPGSAKPAVDAPCLVTIALICMMGSMLASGNMLLPHSMSKLRVRSGAIGSQSPSGGCDMRSL